MNISIIGASGFVGKNLISYLLEKTNHNISAIAPDPQNIIINNINVDKLKIIKSDASDYNQIKEALVETEVAYYFVHMMCCEKKFYEKEAEIAEITGKALKENGVKKVIYMSGLGNKKEKLSQHLASRHNTGEILRKYIKQVIEFRASMIIGKGSISFEIVRNIINKTPIILLPKKSLTETQPITINDALLYLTSALNMPTEENQIIEIGGPEIMSYKKFIEKYKNFKKKKTLIFIIPFLSEKIAGFFFNFFTSKKQASVGRNMIQSFQNKMIKTNNKAEELFPNIKTQQIESAFY